MKGIKKLCAATTLLFVLSLPALAGDIHTNVVQHPPVTPPSVTTPEPGETTTDAIQNATQPETLIAELTLSLLQLLSVV